MSIHHELKAFHEMRLCFHKFNTKTIFRPLTHEYSNKHYGVKHSLQASIFENRFSKIFIKYEKLIYSQVNKSYKYVGDTT